MGEKTWLVDITTSQNGSFGMKTLWHGRTLYVLLGQTAHKPQKIYFIRTILFVSFSFIYFFSIGCCIVLQALSLFIRSSFMHPFSIGYPQPYKNWAYEAKYLSMFVRSGFKHFFLVKQFISLQALNL